MKRTFLLLLLLAGCSALCAQPRIRVDTSPGGKNVDFILENKEHSGTVTVFIDLKEVYNCNMTTGLNKCTTLYDNSRLMSLRADDESYGVGYSYQWNYVYGQVDSQVDTAFLYRMPCSTLRPVRVIQTVDMIDKYTKTRDQQKNLGFMFPLEKGDTVYAVRRGIVTKIEIPQKRTYDASQVSFTTESANITVEQPDGSIARYICFDPENLFVQEGDEVWPSTPLALAGTYDGEHYRISVQVFRYITNPDPQERQKQFFESKIFSPRFATTSGELVPEHGKTYTPLLTREMELRDLTKKEFKQRAGNKK